MAIYEYEHVEEPCSLGKQFEVEQSMRDLPLNRCPQCGGPIQKLISMFSVHAPRGDTQIRDAGFTKLVRRDDGVYENVTAREGESRYMHQDKPETYPHLHKIISD